MDWPAGFRHYGFNMDELLPIEIRIRTLVEDFFANKITGKEFKSELARMKVEFEPAENSKRKSRRTRTAKYIRVSQSESIHAVNP